jgi:acyl-CoA thioesterase FadM
MTTPAFGYERRVTWADCDPAGMWQFTCALEFVEEAEVSLLREAGALTNLYGRLPRAYVEARFHKAASFDDQVSVRLTLVRIGDTSLHYQFDIWLRGDLAVSGKLGVVFVDEQGNPRPLPPAERRLLESWVAEHMEAEADDPLLFGRVDGDPPYSPKSVRRSTKP